MTMWEKLEDIKAFAGEDLETAKYYPEERFCFANSTINRHDWLNYPSAETE